MRRILLLVVAVPALLWLAASAAGQVGEQEPTQASVSARDAQPGDTVVVEGTGWAPETQIDISWNGTQLAFATAEPDGTFAREAPVPDVEPGQTIQIIVRGTSQTGEPTTAEVSLNIVEGTPRGTFVMVAVIAGAVVLVLLVGAWMYFRRRRPSLAQQAAEGETPVRNPDPREQPQPDNEDVRR